MVLQSIENLPVVPEVLLCSGVFEEWYYPAPDNGDFTITMEALLIGI